ncbi:MAG: PmoA family protein [Bryobacteraceae bacterium]
MRIIPLLAILACHGFISAADVTFHARTDSVEVSIDGKPFTTFHYAAKWDKPFLHPIRTAGGMIVTRRWPVEQKTGEIEDHTWHRGLWWSHGDVSGADFWREMGPEKTGRLVLRGKPRTTANRLEVDCDFVAPGGKRKGSVTQQFAFVSKDGLISVDVTLTIRADGGAPVTLGDTEDGGLGFRYSDDFRENRGAALRNAEGLQGTKAIWGKRSRWVDYTTTREGKQIGVAILDHPSNPRHPTYWHARGYGLNAANPFGVRDFTGDKSQNGKIDIPQGGTVRLRYRVAIHEGAEPESLWKAFAAVK